MCGCVCVCMCVLCNSVGVCMCGYCNCVGVYLMSNMHTSTLRLPWLRVFPCFFLSCKANARVTLAKTGHGPHCSKLVVVICAVLLLLCCTVVIELFYVLFVCKCVLYHCHRVFTQLQLTNISCHIMSYHIISYHIISYHIISYHSTLG